MVRTIATQNELPGIESEKIEAIEEGAQELHEIRNQRIPLSQQEGKAVQKLLTLMDEHKLTKYTCQTFKAVVNVKTEKRKVSVKFEPDETDEESGEGEEETE